MTNPEGYQEITPEGARRAFGAIGTIQTGFSYDGGFDTRAIVPLV